MSHLKRKRARLIVKWSFQGDRGKISTLTFTLLYHCYDLWSNKRKLQHFGHIISKIINIVAILTDPNIAGQNVCFSSAP